MWGVCACVGRGGRTPPRGGDSPLSPLHLSPIPSWQAGHSLHRLPPCPCYVHYLELVPLPRLPPPLRRPLLRLAVPVRPVPPLPVVLSSANSFRCFLPPILVKLGTSDAAAAFVGWPASVLAGYCPFVVYSLCLQIRRDNLWLYTPNLQTYNPE